MASNITPDQVKTKQMALLLAGFYGPLKPVGRERDAQIAYEVDGNPKGRTDAAMNRAIAALRTNANPELEEAINTIRAFKGQAALDFAALRAPVPAAAPAAILAGVREPNTSLDDRRRDGRRDPSARPRQGTSQHHTYTVEQVGTKIAVLETTADAWMAANQDQMGAGKTFASRKELYDYLYKINVFYNKDGKRCFSADDLGPDEVTGPEFRQGQVINLPDGNPIGKVRLVEQKCGDCTTKPPAPELPPAAADLDLRAKLPRMPTIGAPGQATAHTVVNAALLLGKKPAQPAVAALGHNQNMTGIHTPRDLLENGLEILYKTPIPIPGTPFGVIAMETHSGRDSAGRVQQAQQGSDGQRNNVNVAPDSRLFNVEEQWPFTGKANPFSLSDEGRRNATLLPGLGTTVNGRGDIVTPEGTKFTNNDLYMTAGGMIAYTASRTAVDSNFTEQNEWLYGTPSSPVELNGLSNYAMTRLVIKQSLEPQIAAAGQAYRQNPNAQTAQQLVNLVNTRYHMTGTSNYPLSMQITYPQSPEAVAKLSAAEQVLYARRAILQDISDKRIPGVDPYGMPAETPIRSIGREKLRENLNEYYNILAEKRPGVFADIYGDQVGGRPNMDDVESRRYSVQRFVDSLEIVRDMPINGVPLIELDRLVSTQSREVPGDVRRNNFNDVENFRIDPRTKPMDPASQATAMAAGTRLLAGNPSLVNLVLQGAERDRQIAETFMIRDLLSQNVPGSMGDHPFMVWSREAAERGYSPQVKATLQSIGYGQGKLRGDLSQAQADLGATAGNPHVLALRQQDIMSMTTDGTRNYAGFEPGSLQTQLLYTIATEPNNETYRQIVRNIQATAGTPEAAAAQIEVFQQALYSAKEQQSRRINGVSHETTALVVNNRVVAAHVVGRASDAVRKSYAQIGNKPAAAQAFVQAIAAGASSVEQNDKYTAIFWQAMNLPEAQRKQVAAAAFTHGIEARAYLAPGMSTVVTDEDRARYQSINPRTMSGDDATFILQTMAKLPQAAAGVLNAIAAKDAKAAQVLTVGIGQNGPLATQVLADIPADQLAVVNRKAGVRNAGPQEIVLPARPGADATYTAIQGRDVGTAAWAVRTTASYYNDKQYPERSIVYARALMADQQGAGLGRALMARTLVDNPELATAVIANLREIGSKSFATTPQDDLARLVARLSAATTDEQRTQVIAELNRFAAVPANAGAMRDMYTAVANGRNANGSYFGTTVETVLQQGLTGRNISGYSYSPEQTRALLFAVAQTADGTNAGPISDLTQTVLSQRPTVPGWQIPLIPVWLGQPPKHHTTPPNPDVPINPFKDCVGCARPTEPPVVTVVRSLR